MVAGARACGWCGARIPARARRDAIYCSQSCRQASHRVKLERSELARVLLPARIAYADPPYVGMARRVYGDHPDYAGEVDHRRLLEQLATFDGWALSCSSDSLLELGATALELGLRPDVAIWHRRHPPHPTARLVTSFECVLFVPSRRVAGGPGRRLSDVLLEAPGARPRRTLPSAVVGMKPPAFARWLFELLEARPGDELVDLFPGSGIFGRYWADYAGDPSLLQSLDASRSDRA